MILVTLAVLSALAGVIAFALLTEQPLSVRLGVLAGGLVLAVLLAWLSPSGQASSCLRPPVLRGNSVASSGPPKKETLNTTGMVMAFVIVMAFFLFLVDKIIEWGLYDVLLRLSILTAPFGDSHEQEHEVVHAACTARWKRASRTLLKNASRAAICVSFGQVLLPIERVQEVRNGRKV